MILDCFRMSLKNYELFLVVEALRSRVQEPQKGVRIIARLLARHQQCLYSFLRDVHNGETIVEEFLQWCWYVINAFKQSLV